jgi:hypothetical protein
MTVLFAVCQYAGEIEQQEEVPKSPKLDLPGKPFSDCSGQGAPACQQSQEEPAVHLHKSIPPQP